jgi:hypothetical protein
MQFIAFLAALAVQPAQTSQPPIIVTAPPPPGKDQSQAFVHDITQASHGQVARYHEPVCPLIVGLEPNSARVVRDRIVETIRGIGAEADANPKCNANLVLVVTDNGREFVQSLRHKLPDWLAGLGPQDIGALVNEHNPARAWSVVSLRNEDGLTAELPGYMPKFRMSRGSPWSMSGRSEVPTMRVRTASIIKQPTRADIEGSVIVIDRSAAVGITLAQLADYTAMRGLARTAVPKDTGVRSILSLFDAGVPRQPELTRSDIIYLQALYKSDGRNDVVKERGRLARAVQSDGRSN